MKKLLIMMTLICTSSAFAGLDYAKKYFADDSDYINFNYFYGMAETEAFPQAKDTHNFQLDFLNRRHAFLYGLGARYSTAGESWGGEVFFNLLIHFAELKEKPMSLGNSFAFAPYFGIQVGLGYHKFDENGAGLDTFASSKTSAVNKFFHNFMVTRLVMGIKIPLNKEIALDISINKNLTMERSFGLGLGTMLKF